MAAHIAYRRTAARALSDWTMAPPRPRVTLVSAMCLQSTKHTKSLPSHFPRHPDVRRARVRGCVSPPSIDLPAGESQCPHHQTHATGYHNTSREGPPKSPRRHIFDSHDRNPQKIHRFRVDAAQGACGYNLPPSQRPAQLGCHGRAVAPRVVVQWQPWRGPHPARHPTIAVPVGG